MGRVATTSKQRRLQVLSSSGDYRKTQPQMGRELTKSTTSLPQQGTTVGGDEGDTPSYRCPQLPRVNNHPSSGCYCTMVTLTTLSTER